MISELLHSSQWCYRHKLNRLGAFMEKIMILTCSAHISGKAKYTQRCHSHMVESALL